jgi:diguanylate cyclase (GGDEF)-like protein
MGMKDGHKRWYIEGLGHRVGALTVALQALEENDAAAEDNIRNLITSIKTSALAYDFASIHVAAQRAEEVGRENLPQTLQALIDVIRSEITGYVAPTASVLIVGGERAFAEQVAQSLEALGRRAMIADTAAEARQILLTREIVFIVMDIFLPDQDGRHFLANLRAKPLTASIPILVLTAKISNGTADQKLVLDAEGFLEKPVKAEKVAEFVLTHLKRAREVTREARRDPLTGLLNRAAFGESYDELMLRYDPAREPIALGLVGINLFDAMVEKYGPAIKDGLLRQTGLALSSSFRATDIVARWGTGEFVVLLPGEDHFGGTRAIEKALDSLSRQKVALTTPDGHILPITLAAGLTVLTEQLPLEEAIERADYFLYVAQYLYVTQESATNQVVSDETKVVRRRERIMLFAREQPTGRIIKQLFERDNFEVVMADSLEKEAMQTLSQERFHLMIIDDDLPDQHGFAILRELRQHPRFSRVPIVVLAANEANMVQALDLGADDYAVKPFPPLAFIARMRRILSRGEQKPAAAVRTVLIVDTDPAQLVIVGSALHKGGLRVALALGGKDGLKRFAETQAEVVIVATSLPSDGLNVLKDMMTVEPRPAKVAVLLAGEEHRLALAQQTVKGEFEVKGVITRPYKPLTLFAELRAALEHDLPASEPTEEDSSLFNSEIQRIATLQIKGK